MLSAPVMGVKRERAVQVRLSRTQDISPDLSPVDTGEERIKMGSFCWIRTASWVVDRAGLPGAKPSTPT